MEKVNKDTREEFLTRNARFINSGLIKELYYNDYVSVFNFADECYLATDYIVDHSGYSLAAIIDKGNIKYVAYDNKGYFDILSQLFNRGVANKIFFRLDDKGYNVLMSIKQQNDKNGPSKFIDKSIDEELLEAKAKERGGK